MNRVAGVQECDATKAKYLLLSPDNKKLKYYYPNLLLMQFLK